MRQPGLAAVSGGLKAGRYDLGLVLVAGLLWFGLNVDFRLSGDAAMYADYVLLGKFNELTLHIGYYALLFAAQHSFGAALGLPIQETAVWLNVVAGTATLGVAYLLAVRLLGSRREALLCVAIFAVSGRLLGNATSSEIYMTQALCVLGSFYLFVRERVAAAGVVAGLALLISPLSAFAYLFYPVHDYQRSGRIRWGVLLRLTGAALAVYLPYLLIYGSELLWGVRGLLVINQVAGLDPLTTLRNFPLFEFKTYTILLLLLLPALWAVRTHWRFLVLALAVALPHLYIILKLTGEDFVFILNTDFFFSCWLVLGWGELAKVRLARWIPPVLWTGHVGLLLVSGAIFRFATHRGYAAEMRGIAERYLLGQNAVMVTDWGTAVGLTFYGRRAVTTTIPNDPLYRQIYDIENVFWMRPGALDVERIYLLDSWHAGPLSQLLRSAASLQQQRQHNSVLTRAEAKLGLRCEPLAQLTNRLYRCSKTS